MLRTSWGWRALKVLVVENIDDFDLVVDDLV